MLDFLKLPWTKSAESKTNCGCQSSGNEHACKLTSAELRLRKDTVIADLKKQVLEKAETKNGFKYRFNGSDATIDQLAEFIKTERQCCPFFIFNLSATDEKDFVWLEVTGKQNVKDFIKRELEI
jgi:hypothetical protein